MKHPRKNRLISEFVIMVENLKGEVCYLTDSSGKGTDSTAL